MNKSTIAIAITAVLQTTPINADGPFLSIDVGPYIMKQNAPVTRHSTLTYNKLDSDNLAIIPTIGYTVDNWYGTLSYTSSKEVNGIAHGASFVKTNNVTTWTSEKVNFSRQDQIVSFHFGRTFSLNNHITFRPEVGLSAWEKRINATSTTITGTTSKYEQRQSTNIYDLSHTTRNINPSGQLILTLGDERLHFNMGVRHIGGINSTIWFLGVSFDFPTKRALKVEQSNEVKLKVFEQ